MVWPRISADRRGLNPNYDSDPRLSAFIRGLNIDSGMTLGLFFGGVVFRAALAQSQTRRSFNSNCVQLAVVPLFVGG
jgi:hypothetical protein